MHVTHTMHRERLVNVIHVLVIGGETHVRCRNAKEMAYAIQRFDPFQGQPDVVVSDALTALGY